MGGVMGYVNDPGCGPGWRINRVGSRVLYLIEDLRSHLRDRADGGDPLFRPGTTKFEPGCQAASPPRLRGEAHCNPIRPTGR